MVATAEMTTVPAGWLRGPSFDLTFIAGVAAIALLSGAVVVAEPRLFAPILLLDLWLLGYHHVVATYTRLCFDGESLRRHRFLLFGLPPLVVAGVVLVYFGVGPWAIATVYLYWQWFHYTRQSFGVSQVYRRKAGDLVDEKPWLTKAALYLLPLWGILHRSYQDPGFFLGMELRVLPVPGWLVDASAFLALSVLALWVVLRVGSWLRGRLAVAHSLYMLSHFVVFYVGYIAIDDITHGWLVINVWHNAQYVLFVWLFNSNRFKDGIDPKARFLSTISQKNKAWLYFGVCLGITTLVYLAIDQAIGQFSHWALPLTLIVYQSINFHHYIVDSLIWKVRRKPMQQTLGIAS